MSHENVRKGITNANFNQEQSGILFGEIFLIAGGLGLYTESWWVFGGLFIGLIIGLFIPFVAIPLMILLSLCWGAIGFGIGTLFGSTAAAAVLGIIGLLAGAGVHMAALEWTKDIGK